MAEEHEKFFSALGEADDALARASNVLNAALEAEGKALAGALKRDDVLGFDEDSNVRRIRRIREDIGTVRSSVEDFGFGYSDD